MSSTAVPKIVPAHLSFLAIYNPLLGSSDETFHQQIVFYYSKAAKARSKLSNGDPQAEQALRERENEKLRQVGLAQGMVGFAKSFSNGEAIDSVETQKSRIVLHQLEEDWWILASINLTQLPASKKDSATNSTDPNVEYSSREVSPPGLLIQQLVRAQSIFLLHHGLSLAVMFAKHDRQKFCNILDKYWSRFASTWDVLLHGSPAVDFYNGIKLAAGGELGIGVGEEEWGSGERDVLENFANKTDGLVDIMVSRFGHTSSLQQAKTSTDLKNLEVTENEPWMGSGSHVHASDGVVFSGLGKISRESLRDMSHWIESIYCHGEYAYGVRDNPTADRRKRRKKNPRQESEHASSKAPTTIRNDGPSPVVPRIPPPIVKTVETSHSKATAAAADATEQEEPPPTPGTKAMLASLGDTETWMKYMTLGYGTAWGGKRADAPPSGVEELAPRRTPSPEPMRYIEPTPDVDMAEERRKLQIQQETDGYFLIGLKGDMEDLSFDDNNEEGNWNNRIPLRTINVEVNHEGNARSFLRADSAETPEFEREMMNFENPPTRKISRVRPVIYVHRPFIYVFLFDPRTGSLTISSFYRNIHHFFSPLHRSLDKSTSPEKAAARVAAAANPHTIASSTKGSEPNTQPIYDLIFDPCALTVQSSIPNIPDPGALIAEGLSSTSSTRLNWSRVEALNVHSQILSTVSSTRRNLTEIERTCKTSRSWWVVWMRLPPSRIDSETLKSQAQSQLPSESQDSATNQGPALFNTDELCEAFLIRRSRDAPVSSNKAGNRFSNAMWSTMGLRGASQSQKMGGAAAGWGPRGLAEGIGVDARRYIEDLLSMNR